MVRLWDKHELVDNMSRMMFQFLNGAIVSQQNNILWSKKKKFQFLNGAIVSAIESGW